MGLEVLGISVVGNIAAGLSLAPLPENVGTDPDQKFERLLLGVLEAMLRND
jgi:hypothetical protein